MTARWWLAVTGCVLLLAGVAAATQIRPTQPDKRTVHLRLVPTDAMPRAVPG